MPPEETPGLVPATASDGAVHHVHHSPPPPPLPSVITGPRDNKRKRRKYYSVNDDALPQELIPAARSTIDADRGATDSEPAGHTGGGAHRIQKRAPAAERTMDAGGSSSRDDRALASPSVAAPPASSSKAIRVKHSSSSFVIGGKQHPGSSPGGGGHSYYASNHAAAAPSSSRRLIVLGPAAPPPPPPPPPHLPAKARRPPSAPAAVTLEPVDDDGECFRRGVEVFGEWDAATQQAAVDRFVRQQSPPEGDGFSFWLTPAEAEEDLAYVHQKVEGARRTSKAAASGSGKPRRH